MNIPLAVRSLTTLEKVLKEDTDPVFIDALKLGREALIAWRQYRRKKAPANLYLLPGETED